MGKLTALDIERVDAVDRPATRRRFILMKAANTDATVDVQAVVDAARLVLVAFADAAAAADATALSPEQVTALTMLAEACGLPELAPASGQPEKQETGGAASESEAAGSAGSTESTTKNTSTASAASAPSATPTAAVEEMAAAVARAVTEALADRLDRFDAALSDLLELSELARALPVAERAGAGAGDVAKRGDGPPSAPGARQSRTAPPSRQAVRAGGAVEERRLGSGLFADVVYGS